MSVEKNANLVPPRSDGTNKNLQQIALGASAIVAIDPILRMRCVRIKVSAACAFYFVNASSGQTVDQTLTTTLGPTSATLGYQMAAGTWEDFDLGGQDNFIVVSGTGFMQLLGSSSRPNGKEGP